MPIELIPADVDPPVGETASPPEEPAVAEPAEVAVPPPVKRGRGRPPGSLNKPRSAPAESVPPPRVLRIITTPHVEEEPPTPVGRRPRAPRKPREYVEPDSPPETPHSYRARVQREYREIRINQHAERRDHYNAMLNRFMH